MNFLFSRPNSRPSYPWFLGLFAYSLTLITPGAVAGTSVTSSDPLGRAEARSELFLKAAFPSAQSGLAGSRRAELAGLIDTPRVTTERVFERVRLPISQSEHILRLGPPPDEVGGVTLVASPSNALAFDVIAIRFSAVDGRSCSFASRVQLQRRWLDTAAAPGQSLVELVGTVGTERRVFHDVSGGGITPVYPGYLIERESGMHRSVNWHSAQDGARSVYKRLVDIDLRQAQYIDLDANANIERINLRFSRRVGDRPTDIVGWDRLPSTRVQEAGRADRIRIDVRALREREWPSWGGGQPLKLVEIIAFSRADMPLVDGARPVSRLTAGYVPSDGVSEGTPLAIKRIGRDLWELLLPLAEVRDRRLASASLQGGEVSLRAGSCDAKFQAAELLSFMPDHPPEWMAAGQRQLHAWGGPFEPHADAAPDTVEWPVPIATLPLRELTSLVAARDPNSGWAPISLDKSLADLAVGVLPSADGSGSLSGSGIELPGAGGAEVRWRVKATLPVGSYLIATGDVGPRAEPPRFSLLLKFAGGFSATSEGRLGVAVDLRAHAGRVLESVVLRFDRKGEVENFSLTDIALFSIKKVQPAQGADLPTAGWHWIRGRALDRVTDRMSRIEGLASDLTDGVQKAALAAVRVDYRVSVRPLVSCWLTVEIAGGPHTASARVCPTGLSGTSAVAAAAEAFDAFPAKQKITKVTWRIAEGAFPPEAAVALQAHHAQMVGPSAADVASRELAVGVDGTAYVPHLTPAVWVQLVKGPTWVHYPAVDVAGGLFHAALSDSLGGAFQVKDWRLSLQGTTVTPQRVTMQPASAAVPWRARVGYLGLILIGAVSVLCTFSWGRSRIAACLRVWNHWPQRALDLGARYADTMADHLKVAGGRRRQQLNLVSPALACGGFGLGLSGVWAPAEQSVLIGTVLLTMFSSASNALRWRAETGRRGPWSRSAWLAGSGRRPPLGVWVLGSGVMLWVALAPLLRELTRAEFISLIEHVGAADVLLYFLPLTMLRLASTFSEPGSWLLWMALCVSFVPWVGYPLGQLIRAPGWRWVRVALGLAGLILLGRTVGFRGPDSLGLAPVAAVLFVWPALCVSLKPRLAARYPALAGHLLGRFSTMYAYGGMVTMALAAALLAKGLQTYAAALAQLVLAFLLGALVSLMWEQWGAGRPRHATPSMQLGLLVTHR
jgi:hypothetical protein